ncbi:hydroxyacid dehydrogenase [Gluconacetobacter sp. 1b LMG 1731]|uniref:Hydroxyacid dehydrogenase n=1 Tax=Gluconacetobacter dulcium TaxID=2729096 RepID=A0A7W4IJC9_9PROT|nr:hydroxyacid dehydrogenase [Gluconacetobacter dulcium]MBB2163804.1 hydroxyacid dehydrogenase [Gluconacetobacter dulcium]MBB2193130.1 hydroxyacid dehydrogenase [Gluconacetobacter dulcium]
MACCFITQPIDERAVAFLHDHGVDVRYASHASMESVMAEIGDAQAVITRDLGLNAEAIRVASALRIIASHGAGTNTIAISEANARGIVVTRTPSANSRSVAELTMGLMLAAARRLCDADRAVRTGEWDFRYHCGGLELHGRTLGLVGFGAVAQDVARIAGQGFGMRVYAWSPSVPDHVFSDLNVQRIRDLPALVRASDILSLHRPSDPGTPPVFNARFAEALRPKTILINTSRGSAIDSQAFLDALEDGRIGAAGLDVLPLEPPPATDPLLTCDRIVLSPHIGGATAEALFRTAMTCARQVLDVLSGREPPHRL